MIINFDSVCNTPVNKISDDYRPQITDNWLYSGDFETSSLTDLTNLATLVVPDQSESDACGYVNYEFYRSDIKIDKEVPANRFPIWLENRIKVDHDINT